MSDCINEYGHRCELEKISFEIYQCNACGKKWKLIEEPETIKWELTED